MEVTYTLPYTYMSGRDHSASLSVGHRCLGTQVSDRGLAEVLTSPNKVMERAWAALSHQPANAEALRGALQQIQEEWCGGDAAYLTEVLEEERRDGLTMLHTAIGQPSPPVVIIEALLDAGLGVNCTCRKYERDGTTPLHCWASVAGGHETVLGGVKKASTVLQPLRNTNAWCSTDTWQMSRGRLNWHPNSTQF